MVNKKNNKIGHYRILRELGHGAMGEVYQAQDVLLDRAVALKVLSEQFASDKDSVERFKIEARAAARLRHPNIVQIYELGESEGKHYFAMEYVPGKTLDDLITLEGGFSIERGLRIISDCAKALDYAHRQNVIHRDIKSSNIMLDDGDRVMVTDFGLARLLDKTSSLALTQKILGTPEYMSPEQCESQQIDRRSDIYSLGIVMYELFTGKVPFKADNALTVMRMHSEQPVPDPTVINPRIPDIVKTFCQRSLEKKPQYRYQNARELQEDIDRYLQEILLEEFAAKQQAISSGTRTSIIGLIDGVIQLDQNNKIVYLNSVICERLGLDRKKLQGQPISTIDTFAWGPGLLQYLIEQVKQTGATKEVERFIGIQGKMFHSKIKVNVADNQPQVLFEDVTNEKAIEESFKRYVSPMVVDEMKKSKQDFFQTQRHKMSVLFADLRGFTSMAEKISPLEVSKTINEFLRTMVAIVEQHKATVDKFVGDQIMVLFGAPLYYEDHALRAAKVALDMQKAHRLLMKRWSKKIENAPGLGIAINSGEMVVGNIGCEQRMEYTALGHNVNVAARLCGKALAGEILVTENTIQAYRNYCAKSKKDDTVMRKVGFLPKPPIKAKGIAKPLKVYAVGFAIDLMGTAKTITTQPSSPEKIAAELNRQETAPIKRAPAPQRQQQQPKVQQPQVPQQPHHQVKPVVIPQINTPAKVSSVSSGSDKVTQVIKEGKRPSKQKSPAMKFKAVIISDLHANLEAAEVILSEIETEKPDMVICLGDIIGYGPNPSELIEIAKGFDINVLGNHDEAAITGMHKGFDKDASVSISWTHMQLKPLRKTDIERKKNWDFLHTLPLFASHEGMVFAHASLSNNRDYVVNYSSAQKIFGDKRMDDMDACFLGHTHIPGIYIEGNPPVFVKSTTTSLPKLGEKKLIVNVGSVGQPRDGEHRACMLIVENQNLTFRRLPYRIVDTERYISHFKLL